MIVYLLWLIFVIKLKNGHYPSDSKPRVIPLCYFIVYHFREMMAVNDFLTVPCKCPRINTHKHDERPKRYWSCHNRLSATPGQYSTVGEIMKNAAICDLLMYKLAPTGVILFSELLKFFSDSSNCYFNEIWSFNVLHLYVHICHYLKKLIHRQWCRALGGEFQLLWICSCLTVL